MPFKKGQSDNPSGMRKGYKIERDRLNNLPNPTHTARAALDYLRSCKPGKRSSGVASVWQALFGQTRAQGFAFAIAVDTYRRIHASTREACVREVRCAVACEPDPVAREAMALLLRRCVELDKEIPCK